ncbi:ribosome-associated heat shock protein Hsp15 [Rubricella aquisinus]|uniref:Ribosome-associated heat shock protein Hsp15 n=1 Tax=Rubricella aquisinus TaxID=2028108 RepID=A0A840WJY7_9RHOB|nr:RNA-binding S4 domain-containing protein [Rubricella aquisinus]MBB5515408.1 ribosome-associated heat shock protein Hsp15 [Rubricella aquisinus]
MADPRPGLRIDKWLWHARFFKTRSLAAKVVAGGIRIGETRVTKASVLVRIGDTVTFPQNRDVRLVQVEALGERRGPAPEAQALYTDLAPVTPKDRAQEPEADRVGGRPTKKDRREMDALRNPVT